ncbi:MAG: DUF1540 domain-containing protein [Firmicutes bacterium]|nr:DUF1540 domain-containing protein [Bacillota bacterium]
MKKSHDNERTIEGIKCIVDNCSYNTLDGKCTASTIEVVPRDASNYDETDCATFKTRDR